MNLIKMLLKFSNGHTAISGDISQFYNVFKLKPEFWNLQLFLWQEAMDPGTPVNIAVIKWQFSLSTPFGGRNETVSRDRQGI